MVLNSNADSSVKKVGELMFVLDEHYDPRDKAKKEKMDSSLIYSSELISVPEAGDVRYCSSRSVSPRQGIWERISKGTNWRLSWVSWDTELKMRIAKVEANQRQHVHPG